MKYQVCRSQHPGLVEVIYTNLEQPEAIKRTQSLNDEAGETVPTYFTRRQYFRKGKKS